MGDEQYLDALLRLPKLSVSGISRDGSWVAWTWFGVGPGADVYAAPVDGSGPPLRLTETDEDTMLVSWAPDGRSVVVGQDTGGDERVQLFRVALDRPGVMEPLTEPAPQYFLHGGDLTPDGSALVYAMNYDVATAAEIEPTWVYRHDLETGERVPIARPVKPTYVDTQLNDQGTHVLYDRGDLHPNGNQIWLVDIDGANDREVLNVGAARQVSASWCPDGRHVLFVAEADAHRWVGEWDRDTGELRRVIDDPARNIEAVFAPRGVAGRLAVIVAIEQAQVRASLLDLESGEETPFPRVPGNLLPLRPLGGSEWICRYAGSQYPADLVRVDLDDPRPEAMISLTGIWDRTPLRADHLAPAEDFRWASVDGMEIQGWLYRAQGEARGTVIYVHGGPTAHSEDALSAQVQFLVHEGFNVLAPNYRGSTGFGLAFQESIKEDGWGGREQDDIRTGIEALIAAGIAQAGTVGITGTSYGGYSSWCAITRFPPDLLAAAAPICGMTDLVVDYETTRPDLRPYSEAMIGGTPEQVPERYHRGSPIHFVDRIRGKLLIIQGMRDPNVSPENVRTVRDALDRAGVRYEVLAFEDEGHGIARPENQRVLFTRLARFFADAALATAD